MRDSIERIRNNFYDRIVYPVYQLKYGSTYGCKVIKNVRQIEKSQWLSQDELSAYQAEKLKKLVEHVYHNVPYYSEIMDKIKLKPEDIKSVKDIRCFPLLTKEKIRENFEKLISNDINKRKVIKASTGGTTGQPLCFFRDMDTCIRTEAALLRGMSWAQYRIGNTGIDFRSSGWPSLLGKMRGKVLRRYYFPALARKEELINYVKKIKQLKPFFLAGYASDLFRISVILHKQEIDDIEIPVIFSTAEMLYDYQRDFIEKHFNGRVFDYYGCNEIGSIAYECEYKQKHISAEHIIVETTDSTGTKMTNNLGELIITDLDNYAMPFIRYRNGDAAIMTSDACSCGRGLQIIKSVEGRTQEYLRTLDGNYIPAIFFPTRFRNLRGVDQYQIIQHDIYNTSLKIVKNRFYSIEELEEMIRVIKEMIGNTVNIIVEECDEIPLTGRGKTRLVISHLPVEL